MTFKKYFTSFALCVALEAQAGETFKILSYMPGANEDHVLLEGGRDHGLIPGSTLRVYRAHSNDGMYVETGVLKVSGVFNDRAMATVINQGSDQSKMLFQQFPGVMAGDFAAPQRLTIARIQKLAAEINLSYDSLFEDPRGNPASFELTVVGIEELASAAAELGHIRAKLLIVEGHTDSAGSSDVNQVESYQRALTVRQYLVDKMGFDPKRLTAVGFGESQLADESETSGSITKNRRIVLKVVPISE
jgi:outer membrane protein OmpA-like peptidoglycan-associated protein